MVERASDRLLVFKGEGDRDLRLIYDVSLDLPGWETVSLEVWGDYYDHFVHPFSADFSRVLFDAVPTGLSAPHVGLLDLVTGVTVDLTAPRQGSDFSSPVLCEDKAGFLSQRQPVAGNGSDAFVFLSRHGTPGLIGGHCFGGRHTSFVSNPAAFSPVPYEAELPDQRVSASEDGRYLFGDLPGINTGEGFYAADGSQSVPVDCVPGVSSSQPRNEFLLGWIGPRSVALAVSDVNNTGGAFDFRTATLQPDGSVTCAGGIPPTDKEITGLSLSFDARAILFSAEGPSGFEQYRQPLDGSPPVPASYPELPDDCDCATYRVGPALPGQ